MAGSFMLDLSRFEEKVAGKEGVMRNVVRKITFELFSRCIMKSPVDTGRFRANWGVMVGSPWLGKVDIYDADGRGTVVLAKNEVMKWNAEGSVFLTNNLPYSIPLEYGHSSQAPAGMVRVSIAEIQAFAEGLAK